MNRRSTPTLRRFRNSPWNRLPRKAAHLAPLLLALAVIMLAAGRADAASIVVNSLADTTGNDGVCTLREAITAAMTNAASGAASGECAAGSVEPTVDLITFSVSGTIPVGSDLPTINVNSGHDSGYISIDGGSNITLQRTSGTTALTVGRGGETTTSVTVKNLTFDDFTGRAFDLIRVDTVVIDNVIITNASGGSQGIRIQNVATTNVTIQNSRIGVDASGNAANSGGNGIQVNDGADNITIRNNIISGNSGDGIQIQGGSGNGSGHLIEDNKIGTNVAGTSCTTDFGNGTIGIAITGGVSSMTIQNNIISCNGRTQAAGGTFGDGIEMSTASTTNNLIKNNYIGTNSSGASMGNHQNGIDINGGTNNTIQGNTIANNGTTATSANNDGIRIDGDDTDDHTITQNSIYNNGGADPEGLGIDLDGDGVTANDGSDNDTGTNAKQNFPVITAAVGNGGTGQYDVTFSWDFEAGEGPWTIEFFCNKDGGGEGQTYQASTSIDAGTANGSITFSFTPVAGTCNDAVNNRITATATNSTGTNSVGSTSEFSAAADPTAVSLQRLDARATTPFIALIVLLVALLGLGAGVMIQRRRPARI